MRNATITATFLSDPKTVWDIVTNLDQFSWRSDLREIRKIDEDHFIEVTKEGYETEFTVTRRTPYTRYEFSMKNKQFEGTWIGEFFPLHSGGTKIDFTEHIRMKNPVIELLSHLFLPLKKIQAQYVGDLRITLGEETLERDIMEDTP